MRFILEDDKNESVVELKLHRYSECEGVCLLAASKGKPGDASILLEIMPDGTIVFRKNVLRSLGFVLDEEEVVHHSVGY